MLAVSAGFLQALKDKSPQDVRLEFANGDVIGTSDIAITSGGLAYTEILNGETDVTFGRAVMSELSAVLINADGQFTDFDFSREFTAKIGVKVGDAFGYVSLGVFKGERPDKVRGKLIEFTAHDRMTLFDKSAESFADGLTFPCTLGEIFTNLCAFCGVGYVSVVFPNSGKTFETNPLEGTDYTCREILGYIAEAAGSYARMSRDGAVELVWFSAADYTVTRTDRFEMTESEFLTPPIDKLEVTNSYGDQLNSSGTGDIVYGISDNPFLYIENDTQLEGLQPYVDTIYNRITSLPAYHPSSFRAEFNPAVQCGDIISVVDDYGMTISFPVFVQTITWNGFGKATYENTGGVIRQNAPFTQRELEQIKKKSLRATDLYTTIDSYLNSDEGVASITQAVGGTFVTKEEAADLVTTSELDARIEAYINGEEGVASITESLAGTFVLEDELEDYATKTEVSTSISQKISAFGASLTLSVKNGEKSSTITLTGDGVTTQSKTIQFTGEVVFQSDLSTAGSTTINGANITTGQISAERIDTSTLRAQQVYYYDESEGYFSVMSSEISGQSTVTRVGPKDIRNGYMQALELYGTAIYFLRPGYTAEDDTHALLFDTDTAEIIPADADRWYIGTESNPFNRIYLDTGLYLYDSDAAGWTRLYIYNGSLTWRDAAGDRHTIV